MHLGAIFQLLFYDWEKKNEKTPEGLFLFQFNGMPFIAGFLIALIVAIVSIVQMQP